LEKKDDASEPLLPFAATNGTEKINSARRHVGALLDLLHTRIECESNRGSR